MDTYYYHLVTRKECASPGWKTLVGRTFSIYTIVSTDETIYRTFTKHACWTF